jgi:hypothetical protein
VKGLADDRATDPELEGQIRRRREVPTGQDVALQYGRNDGPGNPAGQRLTGQRWEASPGAVGCRRFVAGLVGGQGTPEPDLRGHGSPLTVRCLLDGPRMRRPIPGSDIGASPMTGIGPVIAAVASVESDPDRG